MAIIDAIGAVDPLAFFRQRTTQEKKSGGLGVDERNRGYPGGFEFIEHTLNRIEMRLKIQKQNSARIKNLI